MQTGATTFGCSNADADAAFEAFRGALTQEERVDAAHDVQRIMYDTVPVKLVNVFNLGGLRENIQGFVPWYEIRFWSVWRQE